VEEGEILGLLGPNGAGKSTTMKMLTSYILPTSGEAFIDDLSVVTDSIETRKKIGYLPESSPSYKDMTVIEFLNFAATTRSMPKGSLKKRVAQILEQAFLENVANQTIDTLSKGYRQRVGFAQALIHDPKVLILDEPTDGLDPNQKQIVRQLIREMGKTKTIILSTHILEEMEELCSRVVIISEGSVKADGKISELLHMADNFHVVDLHFEDAVAQGFEETLADLDFLSRFQFSENRKILSLYPTEKKVILPKVLDWVQKNKMKVLSLETQKPKMEQVFRKFTLKNNP